MQNQASSASQLIKPACRGLVKARMLTTTTNVWKLKHSLSSLDKPARRVLYVNELTRSC